MNDFWHLETEDFFEGLQDEKNVFLTLASRHLLKRQDTVFLEGETGAACFYIESGLVRIFSSSLTGKEMTLFLRRKGEMFGLAELMDRTSRKASAQALTPSVIYTIGRPAFEKLLQKYFSLTKRVISLLGKRLRYMGKRLSSQNGDVRHRLAFSLISLAYDILQKSPNWEQPCRLPSPISHHHLAAMVGSTQPTVSSVLQDFKNEHLIDTAGHTITLLSPINFIYLLNT
ncbi:MAG: Crp/Fnr family transcriptional regulator [Desulfovibrio sp.]|nr:Crp/Fnr family transcriptional regulator [Desulfovibrio sp.]